MKDIKNINRVYLDEYEVYVNPYLDYAQIQQIVKGAVIAVNWAEKQTNIDMLMLYHATDIGKEVLEQYNHETLLQSGLIDEVKKNIRNLDQLYQAIEWTEGSNNLQRTLGKLIEQLNQFGAQSIKDQLKLQVRDESKSTEKAKKAVTKRGKPSNK